MLCYRVTDWTTEFETSESRKRKGALNWVGFNTKHDGYSFSKLRNHPRRVELFAAFVLIVEVAAKQPTRGVLHNGKKALAPKDISEMTGFPVEIFALAFEVLSDHEAEILWLETVPDGSSSDPRANGNHNPQPRQQLSDPRADGAPPDTPQSAGVCRSLPESAGVCGNFSRLRQVARARDRTEPNETEPDNTEPDLTEQPAENADGGSHDQSHNGSSASVAALVRLSGSASGRARLSRRHAQVEFVKAVSPLMSRDGKQHESDRTCVAQWWDEDIWPEGIEPEAGSARLDQFIEEAKKAIGKRKPMAYLTSRIGRCKL